MNVQEVLNDNIAQELLTSTELARLAYTWKDGTPRVVPIWFHWNGSEVVVASPRIAPKFKVLEQRPQVALTIDSSGTWPYHVLLIRGTARVERTEGVPQEYAASADRYFGPAQGAAWVDNVKQMGLKFARVVVTPTYARILDFETRFPSAIEHAMHEAQPAP
jgi:nitroimidazol reductase NimA-like FMN-containing flavoprotein (pyridoxamine 5'-phosphate oxidase superfamily)